MRRGLLLTLVVALLGSVIAAGCGVGEISDQDQTAKQKALDKVAAESPDADKVEH